MINCEILKFGLKNFCNHNEEIEIDLEGKSGSITMINGRNGTGKSALFQSIPFTLYGSCEKGKPDDVLNNRTKKDCHTWVLFKRDDKKYRVDRYVADTKNRDNVFMYEILDGDILNIIGKGQKEVLPLVEKILVSSQLFTNTILFSQKVKSFFTDLNDAAQKEIFRKILKLDEFVDYQLYAKTKYDKTDLELVETRNKLTGLNSSLESIKGSILHLIDDRKRFIDDQTVTVSTFENEITILKTNKNNFELENDLSEYEKTGKDIIETEGILSRETLVKKDLINSKENIITKLESEKTKDLLVLENKLNADKSTVREKNTTLVSEVLANFQIKNNEKIHLKSLYQKELAEAKNIFDNKINEINNDRLKKEMEISSEFQKIKSEFQQEITDKNNKILSDATETEKTITNSINECEKKKLLASSHRSQVSTEIVRLEGEIQNYTDMISSGVGECPTCLQSMSDTSNLKERITILNYKIQKLQEELISYANSIINEDKTIEDFDILLQKSRILEKESQENLKVLVEEKKLMLKSSYDKALNDLKEITQASLLQENLLYEDIITGKNEGIQKVDDDINTLIKMKDTYLQKIKEQLLISETTLDRDYENETEKVVNDKFFQIQDQTVLYDNNIAITTENIESAEKVLTYLKEKKSGLDNIVIELNKIIEQIKTKNQLMEVEKTRKYDDTTLKLQVTKSKEIQEEIKICKVSENSLITLLEIIHFWWKKAFSSSGIQSMLIDEAIPFLNKNVNKYLNLLSDGRYKVSFDTMKQTKSGDFRDKISVNVFDNVTLSDSRTKFSGGQERIVDIATILALNDLQAFMQNLNINILLFDEIFDSLDAENAENVILMLRKIIGDKVCFLISHINFDHIDFNEKLSMG